MPKYRVRRCLRHNPHCLCFKPQGAPMRQLQKVTLTRAELEALKLKDVDNLLQEEGARRMGISQPTFQRTLASARKKVAQAIVYGEAVMIEEADSVTPA